MNSFFKNVKRVINIESCKIIVIINNMKLLLIAKIVKIFMYVNNF